MTREHVVPAFIYEFQKSHSNKFTGWNDAAQAMTPGELKVKDVCDTCNNVVLGSLDNYAKQLLTASGIMAKNYTKKSVTIDYDYDLLLRWLLKVSFNSSRTTGFFSALFEPYRDYILNGTSRPPSSSVAVVADLAAPILLNEQEALERFGHLATGTQRYNPFHMRISNVTITSGSLYTARLVMIGPLIFFLLFFPGGTTKGHSRAEIRKFIKINKGGSEVTSDRTFMDISAGEKTWLEHYQTQVHRVKALEKKLGKDGMLCTNDRFDMAAPAFEHRA